MSIPLPRKLPVKPDNRRHCLSSSTGCLPRSLLPLLLLAGQAAGAEDSLRQLEADAKRLATTPITTRATAEPGSPDATGRLPSGLQQDAFEQALHDQFMSTYLFYQRLKPEDRAKVFASYQQDARVGTIRELTLKLLSGAP
jgi:hypothetical protein